MLLGVYVQSEVHTARGRCDALVQTEKYTYAFEFKLDKSAQEALAQIETKGYLLPYAQSGKTRVGVGINFFDTAKSGVGMVGETVLNLSYPPCQTPLCPCCFQSSTH